MNALLLDQIHKSFGNVRAVDGLNVTVPKGSIYGFLGPNGAGKTTTLRMIMDIIRPDSGRIQIFGDGAANTKNRIGYMPEERGLYRKMTAAKVLQYFGAIKDMTKAELSKSIPIWMKRVGLTEWADKKVEALSRGMHQKLQFAVTNINDPELLILDEPFSGLDPVNLDLLKEIILGMRDQGKTIIFSTHVMHEAERLCDFILLINKGMPVLDSTLDNIRASWRSNSVVCELEGETGFIQALPMVSSIHEQGKRMEISLIDNADSQELLKALVGRVRVLAFEIKVPTLHEIFVHLIGENNAQNA